jgi:hypothetical protein
MVARYNSRSTSSSSSSPPTRGLPECYKSVIKVLQHCYKSVTRCTSLLLNGSLASQELQLIFHELLRLVIGDLLVSRLHEWRIRLAFGAHLLVL